MYSCNKCGKYFESERYLERHNNRQTPCKLPTDFCSDCNKGFASAKSLWRHRKICSGTGISRKGICRINGIEGCGLLPTTLSNSKCLKIDEESNDDDEEDDDKDSYEAQSEYSDEDVSEEEKSKDVGIPNIPNTFVWKVDESVKKAHSFLLPRDIRGIIVGKSGFGKTTLLNYILLEPNILDYDTLIVCGNSLHQPEYKIMNAAFAKNLSKEQIKTIFEHQNEAMEEGGPENVIENVRDDKCKGNINAQFYTDVSKIPDPVEHDAARKNLLILDDIMLGPQNKAEAYYTRGRHNNFDVFYITQSYFRLPRQTVRENANLFMFFLQDKKNLTHIYNDHCASDGISYETFCKFCSNVWNENKHNFVTIDITQPVDCGKYRKNLSEFWSPLYDKVMQDN